MRINEFFTAEEREMLSTLIKELAVSAKGCISESEYKKIRKELLRAAIEGKLERNCFGMNPIIHNLQTALIVSNEIRSNRAAILSIMLHDLVACNSIDSKTIVMDYGEDVNTIIRGLIRTSSIYSKGPIVESTNFKDLLLSFAEDMRVILIIIADRVNVMRQIRDTENIEDRKKVTNEARYLYAPLAHKLGLYRLKTELEDLSVKYLYKEIYYKIKDKLNQTKAARDKYIAKFIGPIEENLKKAGLKFHIKGRTKSINSIWNKMKKQEVEFEGIYDLFAIRIILNAKPEDEKKACWETYSIVTAMYVPDPKRLRDWLSVPKSNGYESLHTTVMGPEGKWVEIQIRTERMDDIAERGFAAHWRYKGVKDEGGLDEWLASIREALENSDSDDKELMDQFKMDLYKDDVFIFTPKGDLVKLPKGATILDFAFNIHSKIGCQCIGGKVNGKVVPIRQTLTNGDQVEIFTSASQQPKQDWLNIAVTSKARNKIRQVLKENANRQADFAREALQRKFKNKKIDIDYALLSKVIASMGFKDETLFYQRIGDGSLDLNDVFERYMSVSRKLNEPTGDDNVKSAEEFNLSQIQQNDNIKKGSDVLLIDKNMKGLDYKLAKCCNPIYGDDIFAFTTAGGGIKIHRTDCPNASQMRERFGYRILDAKWSGQTGGSQYDITLKVIGQDNIGIVTNLTSVINKEPNVLLRSISISSNDGMFSGMLTISISNKNNLEALVKKLKGIKGVMQISRN